MVKRVICEDNLSRIITNVLKEEFGDYYSFKKDNSCIDSYQIGKMSKEILKLSKGLSVINYLGILSQKDMGRISLVLDECKKIYHTINEQMFFIGTEVSLIVYVILSSLLAYNVT